MHKEAFVYLWQNSKDKKKYIGYHKGDANDGYDTSSKDPEFLEAMAQGYMEREIIAYGTAQDMIALERTMLLEVDAKNNPDYYNKSNGGGGDLKAYIKPSLDEFEEQIKHKEFGVVPVKKEDLVSMERFQVRFDELNPKHVRELKEIIDDNNGDTTNFDPVDILRDYFGKEQHLLLNGNQRRQAVLNSKRAKYIQCQFIPKEVWKDFSKIELEALANRLNRKPEKPALSVNKDDAIKYLKSVHAEGRDIDDQQNFDELHLKLGFTKAQARKFIKSAQQEIDDAKAVPAGAVWIDWKTARKKEAIRIVEQYRDKDSMAFLMSSAGPQMWRALEDSIEFPKKKQMVFVVYHTSPTAESTWFTKYLPLFEKVIKLRLNINVSFTYLPTIDHLAGLQDRQDVV